jgi:hypothetical protein
MWLAAKNALDYYTYELVTAVKSFVGPAQKRDFVFLFVPEFAK